jgi:hypothetical protein
MIKLGKHESFINDVNQHGIVLIDGQHRIAVIDLLLNCAPETVVGQHIVVSVYTGKTRQEIVDYFRDVNDNWEPVPPLNLDEGVNLVVKRVGDWLTQTFSKTMFSESVRCHRPHLYMKGELGLLCELSKNRRIRRLVDDNRDDLELVSSQLISIIDQYNKFLRLQNPPCFQKPGEVDKDCYKGHPKAVDNGLFLGMWSDFIWIDKAFDYHEKPKKKLSIKKKS